MFQYQEAHCFSLLHVRRCKGHVTNSTLNSEFRWEKNQCYLWPNFPNRSCLTFTKTHEFVLLGMSCAILSWKTVGIFSVNSSFHEQALTGQGQEMHPWCQENGPKLLGSIGLKVHLKSLSCDRVLTDMSHWEVKISD